MKNITKYFSSIEETQKLLFSQSLFEMISEYWSPDKALVLLCIGTDKVTGDSLGPFVGHRVNQTLRNFTYSNPSGKPFVFRLYGTLEEPVHAINLEKTLTRIQMEMRNEGYTPDDCVVLVVDASLGYPEHLGYVTLAKKPLSPGEGVKKKLPEVGQISITGIIGEARSSSLKSQMALKHTRLYDLIQLSDFISDGIVSCINHLYLSLRFMCRNSFSDSCDSLLLHQLNERL